MSKVRAGLVVWGLAIASASAPAQCFDSNELLMETEDECSGGGVAIEGGCAALGNLCSDDEDFPGHVSVWRFDPSGKVWNSEARLRPSDGGTSGPHGFALGVAVSGDTVLVGANTGFHPEYTGRVYVYERRQDAWTEAAIWQAENPSTNDSFGWAVAVDSDWAIVGAIGEQPFGSSSGAAYVFHRTGSTWVRHQRLVASTGATNHRFGWSVDISGDVAVVGAPWQGKNTAYVFRLQNGDWIEEQEITGSDTQINDLFGMSVGVNGGRIVVAAPRHNGLVDRSGAVYVFERDADTGDWIQTQKIIRDDALADDRMGESYDGRRGVAVERDFILIGIDKRDRAYLYGRAADAWEHRSTFMSGANAVELGGRSLISGWNDPDGRGALVSMCPDDTDSDGDGLLDSWETAGRGLDVNGDGLIDLDLFALGARPDSQDLFIEIDVMAGVPFLFESITDVVDSFAQAPVVNPDGSTGIRLHAQVDELDLPFEQYWERDFVAFDTAKSLYFGTEAQRFDPNAEHVLAAKKRAYRYCIFANERDDGAFGVAETPGNDFWITMRSLGEEQVTERRPWRWWLAHTFMHELGHNLGLRHSGGYDIDGDDPNNPYYSANYKPNYISCMNYAFDFMRRDRADGRQWPLVVDYSREALLPLDESNLSEPVGLPSDEYADVFVPYGIAESDGSMRVAWAVLDDPDGVDWNGDVDWDDSGVVQDITFYGGGRPQSGPSPGDKLNGFNDWALIELPIGTEGDFADFVHETTDYPDIGNDVVVWHAENIPPPPFGCRADLNGDLLVDTRDVLAFLNLFAAGKGAADFNLDGVIDTRDVLAFLNDWAAGC